MPRRYARLPCVVSLSFSGHFQVVSLWFPFRFSVICVSFPCRFTVVSGLIENAERDCLIRTRAHALQTRPASSDPSRTSRCKHTGAILPELRSLRTGEGVFASGRRQAGA